MATGTFYPAASGDDSYWTSGDINPTSGALYLGAAAAATYNLFVRFPNATIPAGSTITSAYVKFTAGWGHSATAVNVNVYFNNVDDAVAPTTVSGADGLALTSAIAWNNLSSWVDDTQYDTPGLVSILQAIVDRAGWSSGNALQVVIKDNSSTASAYRQASAWDAASQTERAELHVAWDPPVAGEITNTFGMSDTYEADTPYCDISESFGTNAHIELIEFLGTITGSFGTSDTFDCLSEYLASIEEAAGLSDVGIGIFEYFVETTNQLGISDVYVIDKEFHAIIQATAGLDDSNIAGSLFEKLISETISAWGSLKWNWLKTIEDSMSIAETIPNVLGIPIKESLTFKDAQSNTWFGTEAVSDGFFILDISKIIKSYKDLVSDGMDVSDATKAALGLAIADILTCADTVLDVGIFQYSISESITIEDVVRRAFQKLVSESMAITDTNAVDFFVLLQLVDSLAITDTTAPVLTINQTISDAIDALDSIAVGQLIHELLQDGLNIEVVVEIDGDLYECWVINSDKFNISIYSGYDYNSFAVLNNTVYGCRADGIYELEGDTDNGTAFHSGLVLPETRFGSEQNKRFRKAYFGVSGNDLIMKMETETGDRTFSVVDTEMTITRDLKGRKWKLSLEDFDSMESITLFPTILTRR